MKNNHFYPLYFFQIYLFIVLLLYFFGPWNFNAINVSKTAIYLLVSQAIIFCGYILGVRFYQKKYFARQLLIFSGLSGVKFVKQAILVNLLLFIPISLSRTGQFYPDIFFGILHPGEAYLQHYNRLTHSNHFIYAEYLRSFLSPWVIGIMPVLIIYWHYIGKFFKVLAVFCISLNIFLYIATGTNKGVADFVVTLPWFFLLSRIISKKTISSNITYILLFISILSMFMIFFGLTMKGRNIFPAGTYTIAGHEFFPSPGNWVLSLPVFFQILYESLVRYLCHGYYALSLSFDLYHPSTFGLGSSMVLARNADRVFNTNFFENNSIPGLLESNFGFSKEGLWHSIYPWLASDFGFFGALLVLGFFSFLLAFTWCRVITFKNPFEITLLYLLIILFYYIPANNQIFQSLETLLCFNICFVIFLLNIWGKKISFLYIKKIKKFLFF